MWYLTTMLLKCSSFAGFLLFHLPLFSPQQRMQPVVQPEKSQDWVLALQSGQNPIAQMS